MKRLTAGPIAILAALFITCGSFSPTTPGTNGAAFATTLFSDNFDSDVPGNWMVLAGTGITKTVTGGLCQVQNTASSTGLILHSATFTDYTMSVDVVVSDTTYSGVGLFFGVTNQYAGYFYTLGSAQYYLLSKFTGATATPLFTFVNSFMNARTNTLKVSKRGSEIKLYCNGKFLKKIVDSDYSGGSVGFIIPPHVTVSFDNVLVTDENPTMDTVLSYKDNFADGNLTGWYTAYLQGTATCALGVAKLSTPSDAVYPSYMLTSGSYANAGYGRVVVQRQSTTGASSYYGFALAKACSVSTTSYNFKTTFFVVRDSNYCAIIPDSGSYTLNKNSKVRGGLYKDTLEFKKNAAGTYLFFVNGARVDTFANSRHVEFNGAGIVASKDLVVDFDDFIIAPDSLTAAGVIAQGPSARRRYMAANFNTMGGTFFDLLGRTVGNYSAQGSSNSTIGKSRFVIRKSMDAVGAVGEILVK